jgi:hypothetical protein
MLHKNVTTILQTQLRELFKIFGCLCREMTNIPCKRGGRAERTNIPCKRGGRAAQVLHTYKRAQTHIHTCTHICTYTYIYAQVVYLTDIVFIHIYTTCTGPGKAVHAGRRFLACGCAGAAPRAAKPHAAAVQGAPRLIHAHGALSLPCSSCLHVCHARVPSTRSACDGTRSLLYDQRVMARAACSMISV